MGIVTTASGARIAWDAFGDVSQPPMILIQGFSAQMVGWRPGFCQQLADQGFYVIRFDNRDVGQSQRYPQGGYALSDLADDTAAFLDAMGIASAHIVGQSMGGMIAQLLVQQHPDRVRSLGLLYTAANGSHYLSRDVIEERMARPIPQTREEYVPYYVESEGGCASSGYPQDIAWLAEVAGEIWDRGWDPEGTQRQLEALLNAPDRNQALPEIKVPTTLIAGKDDQLINSDATVEIHKLIAGSKLKIFPGMGHELPQPLWSEIAELLAINARSANSKAL
ncbi:alpha/beta fold hydrolase [Stenotrophobium rhamnosiphilum]|uniref:Alpha/beta hydrolase n=1 Tax=Stenotrophobium rhamnosiphilum TaxID=2029166 RepID=A0A2T5ME97_9GAMM|nr:alpha/beta hydrolase [Stenotrophobium rhamnosiphilum]